MASQAPAKKNAAFTLYFTLYKNDGAVVADPGTITKKVSIDGGNVADIAATFVEPIADNKGGESYKRSLLKGLVKRAFDNVERRRKGEVAEETHFYYG